MHSRSLVRAPTLTLCHATAEARAPMPWRSPSALRPAARAHRTEGHWSSFPRARIAPHRPSALLLFRPHRPLPCPPRLLPCLRPRLRPCLLRRRRSHLLNHPHRPLVVRPTRLPHPLPLPLRHLATARNHSLSTLRCNTKRTHNVFILRYRRVCTLPSWAVCAHARRRRPQVRLEDCAASPLMARRPTRTVVSFARALERDSNAPSVSHRLPLRTLHRAMSWELSLRLPFIRALCLCRCNTHLTQRNQSMLSSPVLH
mmetsp:Transcript_718/g.2243  ORF Transcript_718/g.2243 Transcript_718/m.2243 type:complete len:257 (+) Transcript_718:360-1130(+)